MKRDLLISASFANLAFWSGWSHVLSPGSGYYRPLTREIAVVSCSVALTAFVIWSVICLARRTGDVRILRWTKLVLAAVAVDSILSNLVSGKLEVWTRLCFLGGLCLSIIVLTRFQFRIASLFFLWCSPFLLVTYGEAAWILGHSKKIDSHALHPTRQSQQNRRVLWIIFDELDEHVAFEARPQTVQLPELDGLKAESWYATSAYPPANYTELSIPALMIGRMVTDSRPLSATELSLKVSDSYGMLLWSKQQSVLSDAKLLGFRTALVGWYHPYCDVLGNDLDYCVQVKCTDCLEIPRSTVGGEIERTFLFTTPPLPDIRKRRIQEYESVRNSAIGALDAFDSGVLVLHLPVPHPQGIYDRRFNRLSVDGASGYLDNLVLVDRTLGDLRAVLERRGRWDETTVVLTSDHWWRVRYWSKQSDWTQEEDAFSTKTDHRVPLMVKLPYQKESWAYNAPLNTVITRDLIPSMLKGDIESPRQLSFRVDGLRQSQKLAPFYRDYDSQTGHFSPVTN